MRNTRTSLIAIVATTALLFAACSSSDDAADTTNESTTTVPIAAEYASAFSEPGPYPVGITTLELASGPLVEVWYPAVQGTTGTDTYDMREFTPEAIQALLTGDAPSTFTIDAGRDAEAAEGPFPVVLFSHGSAGIRLQSSFLTSHLASWGMVVASPDHPSRDLNSRLGGGPEEPTNSVDDLLGTLALLGGQNQDGPLAGRMDLDSVAAVGHSAGGGTVLAAASDPAIDGYVSMASGILGGDDSPALPAKPSFFMAGSEDAVVPPERTRSAFEAVPTPSLLWVLEGVGHNGFDDFCTFGNGQGIIGVAIASGLGGLLESQPALKALGEDGCVPPAVPVTDTFPIINHAVTSWLRSLFGVDSEPVGLGPVVADDYAVPVDIQVRD
jgi:pimeloyl-ACP methyl ester carboxylesterase